MLCREPATVRGLAPITSVTVTRVPAVMRVFKFHLKISQSLLMSRQSNKSDSLWRQSERNLWGGFPTPRTSRSKVLAVCARSRARARHTRISLTLHLGSVQMPQTPFNLCGRAAYYSLAQRGSLPGGSGVPAAPRGGDKQVNGIIREDLPHNP